MLLADKLRKMRDEVGISQERLAEKLGVSRQAVAKWEIGVAMPDVDNLIQISNFFQVSIDYLVKMESYPDTKCESSYENSEIIKFVILAKQNTYAAGEDGAGKVPSSRLESMDLFYEKGDFKYLDTFVGDAHFSGEEVVWYQDKPIWAMNYSGRVLDDKLGNFLKESLLQVSMKAPYRGPEIYRDGKYVYVNLVSGEFDWFQGVEKIYYEDELIYELVYHGGSVK